MRARLGAAVFALSCTAGLCSAPLSVGAQSMTPTSTAVPAIITSATGEAKLTPDRATIYVGVQSRAATAAAAARDNAQRQTAVIDGISALGISRQQISTENYSVAPETRFDPKTQASTVTGYVVSNVVRVDVQRIDQVAPVIDASLAKGANQINSLEFSASNSEATRRQALVEAVARARGDAEAMARAAGGSLGQLLELSTGDGGPRPVFSAMANARSAAPTPIQAGEQTLQATVTCRWQFVPQK